MQQYKYRLEKGSKKHLCPGCGKRCFVRYVDTEDGNYLPEHYGRCDRESKCGYYLNPYTDGYAKANSEQRDYKEVQQKQYARAREAKLVTKPAPVFVPDEVFSQTLKNYEQNTFIQSLLNRVAYPFTTTDIEKVISLYYLGTVANGYRAGAVTFPFINFNGNITAIQVKQFDTKNNTIGTDFLHSIIEKHYFRNKQPLPNWLEQYTKQDRRINSLFGEHLLNKYPLNPVALVEAPKTAVYGSIYFGFPDIPDGFIWLAVYNKSSFNYEKIKVLKGRDVYVFPDLSKDGGTFAEWQHKADTMAQQLPGTRFIFSDLLEQYAPQVNRKDGDDIADFLIRLDWRNFRKKESIEIPLQLPVMYTPSEKSEKCEHSEKTFISEPTHIQTYETDKDEVLIPMKKSIWDEAITELETFFNAMPLPEKKINLKAGTKITNIKLFVKSHLSIIKAQNGKIVYLPYLERLQELRALLSL